MKHNKIGLVDLSKIIFFGANSPVVHFRVHISCCIQRGFYIIRHGKIVHCEYSVWLACLLIVP